MKLSKWSVLICVLAAGMVMLSACGGGAAEPTAAPTEPPPPAETPAPPTATAAPPTPTVVPETPTPEPTPTPVGPPPGTAENPFVIAATDLTGLHQVVSGMLAQQTGYTIEPRAYPTDVELAGSLASGEAPHAIIAFPGGYLAAHELYGYEVALVGTQLGGQVGYTAEFIAGSATGISSLADVAGRSICWGNPSFLAGYKVQRLMLWAEGINPDTDLGQATTLMTQDQVAAAVLIGDCEVGTVAEGTIERLADQYPDIATRLVVVAESPLIPSMTLSFAPGVPDEVKAAVIAGFQALAGGAEAQLLGAAYGWETLEEAEDSLYDPVRGLLTAAQKGAEDLM